MDDLEKAQSDAQFSLEAIKQYHKVRIDEEAALLTVLEQLHHKNALNQTKSKEQIEQESLDIIQKYHEAHLATMTGIEKSEHLATVKAKRDEDIKAEREKLNSQIALYETLAKLDESYVSELEARKAELQNKEDKWAEDTKKLNKSIYDAKMEALKEEEAAKKRVIDLDTQAKKDKKDATGIKGAITQAKEGNILDPKSGAIASLVNGLSKANPAALKDGLKDNADKAREKADASAERVDELKALYEQAQADGADEETLAKILEEGQKAQLEATKDANKAAAAEMASAVADAISGDYKKAFSDAESILNDYKGVIDARMQGSDKNFKDLSNTISSNLSISPYVKTTKVLDKLKEATEKGINYNIEQRSFLASLSDRIATTFDAFDSNLMRIIRLQQADSTASRLGMEASLTKLFNNMFEDTSYLSDVADSISSAIVDAQSQLNHEASAEFEYIVQKWLGALSSLGMSSDSLTQIATGLNYLATGDVTNLASNSSLQTMFAMAASNANLEYSEILLNGLDANTTNRLLESMVVYLKDIADNSENQVVKAAYGDIFNMSHSDMRALSNITSDEISSLAGNVMTYSQMQGELNNQFNQLKNRTSLATMLTNVYDNVMYGVASDMVNNPVTYSMQKMLDFMDEKKIDISIPFINAMGFGLDLNTSVAGLMRMGLGIGQGLSLAGNILSGLSAGGDGLNLDAWNAKETTTRGVGLNNLGTLSTLGGTSGSVGTFATSGNSSDITNSSISSATDDAEETKKITNKNSKPPDKNIEDLYKAVVGDSAEAYVVTEDSILKSVFDPSLEALKVRIMGLNQLENPIPVFDSALKAELNTRMEELRYLISEHYTMQAKQPGIEELSQPILAGLSLLDFSVHDTTLQKVYDNNLGSLKISIHDITPINGAIPVFDAALKEGLGSEISAINTLLSTHHESGIQQVKLVDGTILKIEKDAVAAALKEVLFADEDKNLNDLIDKVSDGTLKIDSITQPVQVKNVTGDKLQVSNLVW